jgi:hypothetical protein
MSGGPGLLTFAGVLQAEHIRLAAAAVVAACGRVRGLSRCLGPTSDANADSVPLEFESNAEYALLLSTDQPRRFSLAFDCRGEDGVQAMLRAMAALAADLAGRGGLLHGVIRRTVGGHCMPYLPLVEDATHLVACAREDVSRAYRDIRAFTEAWEEVEPAGPLHIHTRAMDATENPDFLARVLRGQMAMARAADPSRITFYAPRFADGEFDVLNAGDRTLIGTGYSPGQRVYVFSGHTPPGTELRCIDILNAWRLIDSGELDDGRPVQEVQAVFMDQEQAGRAAPLLRAAGVIVMWEDAAAVMHRFDS